MALDPAVAAVRLAVRRASGSPTGATRCWSPAPAAPTRWRCSPRRSSRPARRGSAVVGVDRRPRAAGRARPSTRPRSSRRWRALGVDETASIRVTVDPGPGGPEAAAREARYAALEQLAEHFDAAAGPARPHPRRPGRDRAARPGPRLGGRSLRGCAGASATRTRLRAPAARLTRAQTEAACRAEGIESWDDPHNNDPRFTRARVRHTVLPVLERELGPGIAEALARTAEQLRDDMDFLEPFELEAYARARTDDGVDCSRSTTWATRSGPVAPSGPRSTPGAIASELTRAHVLAVLGLLGHEGQGDPAPRPRHGVRRRRGAALPADRASRIVQNAMPLSPRAVSGFSFWTIRGLRRPATRGSARGRGRRRRGCRGRSRPPGAPSPRPRRTSRRASRICSAADAGVPITQRSRHRLDQALVLGGDRLRLGVLDQRCGRERLHRCAGRPSPAAAAGPAGRPPPASRRRPR